MRQQISNYEAENMAEKESSRERILSLLEQNRGVFVSGEQIAEQLNISRNSVWKAVRALRKEGYKIAAVTNRGYNLTEDNDKLSVQGIRQYLQIPENACRIQVYKELPSTNLTAKELAIQGVPHGTVIIAERQTAGAGRASGSFFSPEGGLYMSLVIRPDDSEKGKNKERFALRAADSAAQAVEEVCGVKPEIQNSRDLLLNGRKICGILTESGGEIETGMIHWLVLGIGIHFSTPADAFPEELKDTDGSIYPKMNAEHYIKHPHATRNHLAAAIINRIL